MAQKREAELNSIIDEEKLRPDETKEFIDNAFRDGAIAMSGTVITRILPPVSKFAPNDGYSAKKQSVI